MAKKKYVPVRLDVEIFESVKKVALSQGRSLSETVGILVRKSLESGLVSGPEIDLEILRKAIREERDEHERTRPELAAMGLLPDPPNVPVLSPEVVRYQIETLVRIEFFFESMTEASPNGEAKLRDWNKKAKEKSEKTLKSLHMERSV